MVEGPFVPDSVRSEITHDRQYVRLTFERDDGESREIVMAQSWLPVLHAELQKRTAPGQMVPIDRASLQIGAKYSLQGFQARRNQNGSAVLTLAIDLLDQGRVVTLPIDLSAEEREDIIRMLGGQP